MMHKAWCSIAEVPYLFSGSSIKFQRHTGWKIEDLNPIWVRLLGWSQLSNPSDLPCWLKTTRQIDTSMFFCDTNKNSRLLSSPNLCYSLLLYCVTGSQCMECQALWQLIAFKFGTFNIRNVNILLTHLPLVPHICNSKLGQHWFR